MSAEPARFGFLHYGTKETEDLFKTLWKGQAEPVDRKFLGGVASQLRAWAHWNPTDGFQGMGLTDGGELVALNVSYVGKQKRGRWGRYVQSHYAYTFPARRRQGHAKTLFRYAERKWVEQGAHRLKDLIGSWLGVYLHRSLGHTIWGLEKNGHLVIDHPLVIEYAHDGIPANVARQIPGCDRPMPYDEGERVFGGYGKGKALPRACG